jgi:DNA-binding MarR family transcriptional regulator
LSARDHSAGFGDVLEAMMAAKNRDRFGYRITLWANFYAGPVYAEIERRFGLLHDEWNILDHLANYGPLTARSICESTGRPKNSVSRAVERLALAELIDRKPATGDGRKVILSIRPKGRRLFARTVPLYLAREKLMLQGLGTRERRRLDRLLDKLIASSGAWRTTY